MIVNNFVTIKAEDRSMYILKISRKKLFDK